MPDDCGVKCDIKLQMDDVVRRNEEQDRKLDDHGKALEKHGEVLENVQMLAQKTYYAIAGTNGSKGIAKQMEEREAFERKFYAERDEEIKTRSGRIAGIVDKLIYIAIISALAYFFNLFKTMGAL